MVQIFSLPSPGLFFYLFILELPWLQSLFEFNFDVNFPIHLKFRDFTVPCIVLTSFHTDDEASWLQNTELQPRWAAPSDLRH